MPPQDFVHRQATRYNCKYCNAFVRNTPLEKRNHEATPRHQGNLQRFLRDLHRTNEREAREAQRAKAELARVNRIPKDASDGSGQTARVAPLASKNNGTSAQAKAGPEERRRQMAQLAAMGVAVPNTFRKENTIGVAVPDEFLRENAIAGEWQIIGVQEQPQKQTRIAATRLGSERRAKREEEDYKEASKDEDGQTEEGEGEGYSRGIRKRKLEGEVVEDITLKEGRRKPRWGQDIKINGSRDFEDDDLEALLDSTSTIKTKREADSSMPIKLEGEGKDEESLIGALSADAAITREFNDEGKRAKALEAEEPDVGSLFKKRTSKSFR